MQVLLVLFRILVIPGLTSCGVQVVLWVVFFSIISLDAVHEHIGDLETSAISRSRYGIAGRSQAGDQLAWAGG